jgi:hypothetical protein
MRWCIGKPFLAPSPRAFSFSRVKTRPVTAGLALAPPRRSLNGVGHFVACEQRGIEPCVFLSRRRLGLTFGQGGAGNRHRLGKAVILSPHPHA